MSPAAWRTRYLVLRTLRWKILVFPAWLEIFDSLVWHRLSVVAARCEPLSTDCGADSFGRRQVAKITGKSLAL
jgi:hypothetical protein